MKVISLVILLWLLWIIPASAQLPRPQILIGTYNFNEFDMDVRVKIDHGDSLIVHCLFNGSPIVVDTWGQRMQVKCQ